VDVGSNGGRRYFYVGRWKELQRIMEREHDAWQGDI